jgi:RNA-directed DNA polymerase
MPDVRLPGDMETLARQFRSMSSIQSVAALLNVRLKDLQYYLYRPGLNKYRQFKVLKKGGGYRNLAEPIKGFKIIQKRLAQVLSCVYRPRPSVNGFVSKRSIATNAQLHQKQAWILNLDLQDFFPSINFGRVRGMFLSPPYSLSPGVATVLAQICCFDNQLPQGAPTSPIISNMICAKMDSELERIAKRRRCTYSRYADDLTFSSSDDHFPKAFAYENDEMDIKQVVIGDELESAINENGFRVNYKKVRLRNSSQRQEVTGLIVNDKVNVSRSYVRQIRAMLHAWRKYGLENAERKYIDDYSHKSRAPFRGNISFMQVVKGKLDFLAMVRGNDDSLHRKLLEQYAALNLHYVLPPLGRTPNHLSKPEDEIWVLESRSITGDFAQGTGFYLEGVGLVTCAHVVLDTTWAFKPETPERRFFTETVKFDKDLDLAVLAFSGRHSYKFTKSSTKLKRGDLITIAGFPNWAPGATLVVDNGKIIGFRTWFEKPRLMASCKIISGASGAPVMDIYNRLVGIAVRGPERISSADEDETDYGIIPISELEKL